jgi:L-alanine-DL-glutamate epimerase-like enolase superfamily enzyme
LSEAHDRLSDSTSIQIRQALEEFEPMWFETLVMCTDIAATIEVSRAINVPVASGERFKRLSQCLDLVDLRVVCRMQTEPLNIGGISGTMQSVAIAESTEMYIVLHQTQSPLNAAVNAHIHASIPIFLIQECFDDFLAPWANEIMTGVPQVIGGYLEPSNEPGMGVQLNF